MYSLKSRNNQESNGNSTCIMYQSFVSPAPLGPGIVGLKCQVLTSDESRQCRGFARVFISCHSLIFQFHQNNSQLLFYIIVCLRGARVFSWNFTTDRTPQCQAFSRALKIEKLKAPLFLGSRGAGDTIDWCITYTN